jgi:hypothetical protein
VEVKMVFQAVRYWVSDRKDDDDDDDDDDANDDDGEVCDRLDESAGG